MAVSCKEQQVRVEEEVLQPIDRWENQLKEQCKNEPCKWWMLCLNKLFCWMAWVLVKICEWVAIIVVRWLYRIVCVVVSLVLGVLALLIGNTAILAQAVEDLWELIKDGFFFALGATVFAGILIIDRVQTILGVQEKKRPLTAEEREMLWPIFRDSLLYDAIRIVPGSSGLLTTTDRALTMGYTIYMPIYAEDTLVHECVHVWQFEFGGTQYIGQSAIFQGIYMLGGPYPYDWVASIGTGSNAWYLLNNIEAQAQFIEDVFDYGRFNFNDGTFIEGDGVFFRENDKGGHNEFIYPLDVGVDYTEIANQAWIIIRTS